MNDASMTEEAGKTPRPVGVWSLAAPLETQALIGRIEAAGPEIERAAAESDRTRRLADDAMAALHGAGLFRLLLPREVGGEEIPLPRFLAAVEAVARFDGSAAWCVCQGNACALLAGYLDPEVAREIWADDPRAVLAWGPGRSEARAADGGYVVTTRNSFVSGSHHATWLASHCPVVERDGTPRVGADGAQENRTAMFPASAVRLADQWDAVGLRGSGSDSYEVEGLFVPDAHTIVRATMMEDRPRRSSLHGLPQMAVYAVGFAATALGIGRGVLDAFIALAQEKKPRGSTTLLSDSPLVRDEVARGEARLGAARAFLAVAAEEGARDVATEGRLSEAARMRIRLAGTHAIHEAKAVVDMLMDSAGTSAVFTDGPFERRFRDIHTVALQIQARKSHYAAVGGWMFGDAVDTSTMW